MLFKASFDLYCATGADSTHEVNKCSGYVELVEISAPVSKR